MTVMEYKWIVLLVWHDIHHIRCDDDTIETDDYLPGN